MMRTRALLLGLALALVAALGAGAAPADAAATRVVALEWDAVENLMVLGVTPVGAADLKGYDQWVPVARRTGTTDVGLRQAPSLTRIASLRPDLIIAPDYRVTTNLSSLRKIAPVIVTKPYPSGGDGAQYAAMVRDFRTIAKAVGRTREGEAVVRGLNRTLATSSKKLKKARRAGIALTISTPGGTLGAPAVRMFTDNAAPVEVMRRLGLRNAWTGATQRYGYATVGVEAYRRVQSGWLAFIYPKEFAPIIERFTDQPSFRNLSFVKGKRVRTLPGDTWLYGGPKSAAIFAQRLTVALTARS